MLIAAAGVSIQLVDSSRVFPGASAPSPALPDCPAPVSFSGRMLALQIGGIIPPAHPGLLLGLLPAQEDILDASLPDGGC